MDIIISKNEVLEYKKLTILSKITLTKEKLSLFEKKYECSLDDFRTKIENSKEKYDEWDDYIEWKAYSESLKDLKKKLNELENAKNIKVI